MTGTRISRSEQKALNKAADEKHKLLCAEAVRIVQSGACPQCGRGFRRNSSLAGWYQCVQYGAVGFRKDSSQPSCSFQCFTE